MSNGRIEIPLSEYNAMGDKIKEHEKIIDEISRKASKLEEENEALRGFLGELFEMDTIDRIMQWGKIKERIGELLKIEE